MEEFFNEIMECFNKYTNKESIAKYKKHNKKIKIDLHYLLLYKFLNSCFTKEESVECLRKFVDYNRTSFHRQEQQIDLCFYENLNNDISKICNKYIKINNKNKYTFMAIDGTYSNGENHLNSLNMGYFDVINDIPIEIDLKGTESKNKEVDELVNKINSDLPFFKNKVIIVDRLYFCYKFIHFLIQNNIKFIIRCKGDCKNLKLNKITKDKELIKLIKDNVRIIEYKDTIEKTINIAKKSKTKTQTIQYSVDIKNDCVLITNLSRHFNNTKILNLYKLRWKIETYFKLVKNNFNFQHLTHMQELEIKKQFLCINTICSMVKVLNFYLTKNKKDSSKDLLEEFIIKCNESKLIRFFEKSFLNDLITNNKTYSYKTFNKNIKPYVDIRKYKKDQSNPRQCKTPFMKWYIKAYSNQSELVKILEAIDSGVLDNLNNNLKTKSKKIKILAKRIIGKIT